MALNATALERLEMAQTVNRRLVFMRELKEGTDCSFTPPAEDCFKHTLSLRRAILGKDVDPTELNLVEVETVIDKDDNKMETFPLVYLRGSDMMQASLELTTGNTIKFKLAKGKGPVFIFGEYTQEWMDEAPEESLDGDVDGEAESEDEEEAEAKENGEGETKESKQNGNGIGAVAAAKTLAADRKRKSEAEIEESDAGAKKQRVNGTADEADVSMTEEAEKTEA